MKSPIKSLLFGIFLIVFSSLLQGADLFKAVSAVYPSLVRIHVVSESEKSGRMQKSRSSGSGTIIDDQGHILTNHHVAGRGTRITVRLSDRQELHAALVGTDPLSDLAVLKVDPADRRDAAKPLPVATFGDSSQLKVGDPVLAMGSPAGISQSVTRGIVANTEMIAPGGSLRLDGESVGELVRWIGHDAIIYPGNSGGPLVNLEGEIVGINEVGIGSLGGAIPANLARKVAAELIAKGSVARSWIGLNAQPHMKSTDHEGVLVAGVIDGSPAKEAGLQAGDVLVTCNGRPITTARAPEDIPLFNRMILESPIGKPIQLEGLRDGKPMKWTPRAWKREPAEPREKELAAWGIAVRDLTKLTAKKLLRDNPEAVLVQSVRTGGAASSAKPPIPRRALILSMNGTPTPDLQTLTKQTDEITAQSEDPVPTLVEFEVDGARLLTVVELGPQPETDPPTVVRKASLAVDTQVISRDLAKALGIPDTSGVRITRVHRDSSASDAGLKAGDLILKVDGEVIAAKRPEDADVFATMLRQYRVGSEVDLLIRRDGESKTLKVTLERAHQRKSDLATEESEWLEFNARDLGESDLADRKLPGDFSGVLVTAVSRSGWAAIGGLNTGDILISINDKAIDSTDALKSILKEAQEAETNSLTFFVRRGISTRFLEIEPTP